MELLSKQASKQASKLPCGQRWVLWLIICAFTSQPVSFALPSESQLRSLRSAERVTTPQSKRKAILAHRHQRDQAITRILDQAASPMALVDVVKAVRQIRDFRDDSEGAILTRIRDLRHPNLDRERPDLRRSPSSVEDIKTVKDLLLAILSAAKEPMTVPRLTDALRSVAGYEQLTEATVRAYVSKDQQLRRHPNLRKAYSHEARKRTREARRAILREILDQSSTVIGVRELTGRLRQRPGFEDVKVKQVERDLIGSPLRRHPRLEQTPRPLLPPPLKETSGERLAEARPSQPVREEGPRLSLGHSLRPVLRLKQRPPEDSPREAPEAPEDSPLPQGSSGVGAAAAVGHAL